MQVQLDLRFVVLRGSERLLVDIVDEFGEKQSLPPLPTDVALDSLHMVLLDMLARRRDSSAHPVVRPEGEVPTALVPKNGPRGGT